MENPETNIVKDTLDDWQIILFCAVLLLEFLKIFEMHNFFYTFFFFFFLVTETCFVPLSV